MGAVRRHRRVGDRRQVGEEHRPVHHASPGASAPHHDGARRPTGRSSSTPGGRRTRGAPPRRRRASGSGGCARRPAPILLVAVLRLGGRPAPHERGRRRGGGALQPVDERLARIAAPTRRCGARTSRAVGEAHAAHRAAAARDRGDRGLRRRPMPPAASSGAAWPSGSIAAAADGAADLQHVAHRQHERARARCRASRATHPTDRPGGEHRGQDGIAREELAQHRRRRSSGSTAASWSRLAAAWPSTPFEPGEAVGKVSGALGDQAGGRASPRARYAAIALHLVGSSSRRASRVRSTSWNTGQAIWSSQRHVDRAGFDVEVAQAVAPRRSSSSITGVLRNEM